MRRAAIVTSLIILAGVSTYIFLNMPGDHPLYAEKSIADAKFYNDSGHGAEVQTSDIIFTLVQSLGDCDIIGKIEIKTNGDIGICTATGWKIHQPDE